MKLLIAAAATAAALVLAGSAAADQNYTDSTGEVAGSADISTVAVSNNPTAKTVSFVLTTNLQAMDANTLFGVLIDSDQNASTGVSGFDSLVGVTNQGAVAINLTSQTAVPEAQSSFANGVWSITLPAADVGITGSAFNFVAFTDVGDPNNPTEDDAPDSGVWSYTMTQPPPPPPPPPPVATVSSVSATFVGVPTHGKTFHVTGLKVDLSTGVVTNATALKCSATLGGGHLAGTGAGGCTFHLPATAKGKKLVVRVSGKYKAKAVSKTYSFKVK